MRAFLVLILLAFSCLGVPVRAADKAHDADVAAINQVVEQFKAAIIAHDGKALGSLFMQDHDSWLSVAAVDDAAFAAVKARNPAARRVRKGSWREFADMVQNASKPMEERFYNVRIDTNGAVGSVYFDFDFLSDGKVTNRGSETWQMVRAEDGWKIGAMLFSMGR
jgi:ketosteroid isomerase-like protein